MISLQPDFPGGREQVGEQDSECREGGVNHCQSGPAR